VERGAIDASLESRLEPEPSDIASDES